jgi:hypothetical protein
MGLVRSLVKFITDPKPVSTLSDLEPGRAIIEGIARAGEEGTLVSPVRGQPCLAFYYRAFHVVGSRSGQMMPRKLRTHEVYHPFELELPDGRLRAVPKTSDDFTAADHKALSGAGYQGFRAVEDLFSLGTRVRIWGVAKRDGEQWTLVYSKIERLSTTIEGDASQKKKKKKKKAKAKYKVK